MRPIRWRIIAVSIETNNSTAYHDSKLGERMKAIEEHVTLSKFLEHMKMPCEQPFGLEILEGHLRYAMILYYMPQPAQEPSSNTSRRRNVKKKTAILA